MWDIFLGDCLPINLTLEDENGDPAPYSGAIEIEAVWVGQTCDPVRIETVTRDDEAGTLSGTFSSAQTELFPIGKKTKIRIVHTNDGCVETDELGLVTVRK